MQHKSLESSFQKSDLGLWLWLFPIIYLIHLGEEYFGGEGFAAWINHVAGAQFSERDFLVLNAIGLMFMSVGVVLIRKNSWRWLLVGVSGVVMLNGLLHLFGSLLTRSYSPGLISGGLCWLPLGTATLFCQWKVMARKSFFIGIGIAIGLHTIVSLLALWS